MNMNAKFQLYPPYASEEKIFEFFFSKIYLPFKLPRKPIKFSDLDKIHTVYKGLFKEHFC